jgi:signal transduction histidine kinase
MNQCVLCGADISQGILCDKCDRPRKKTAPKPATETAPPKVTAEPPPAKPSAGTGTTTSRPKSSAQPAVDPFPKAQVVPFPVESTSIAGTSVCDVLMATRVPAILLGPDKAPKFLTAEARVLLSLDPARLPGADELERLIGMSVPDLRAPFARNISIGSHKVLLSIVPVSGSSGGAVMILRPHDPAVAIQSAFMSYAEETIINPLRSLQGSLAAAAKERGNDPTLGDAAATIDQILTAFELAPGVEETERMTHETAPGVNDVVRRVGDRFTSVAERKKVLLQIDATDTDETFKDHHNLEEVLVVMMENALHYTDEGGQIVLGLRTLEHKGKPLLLFFVMDSGPPVPDSLKEVIFNPGFSWKPDGSERSGRGLSRCKDFATTHGGSVWVESKTGKACTFFLRVRPDSAR